MEDDYDIYGDLEGFEADAAKDNKVVQELNAQIAQLRDKIAEKESEKQDTITRNTILLENISSLLVTAKAELKRKDAVIADIRRERDNAAFRRNAGRPPPPPVQKHDQSTQTTLIKLLDRTVQTDSVVAAVDMTRVKKEREVERHKEWHRDRSRNRVEEEHHWEELRQRDRYKTKERVPVRERLGERGLVRRDVRRGRDLHHEEERERERKARRGPRSPDAERIRSAVRFRSPVRLKTEDSSVPDSASDIELSRTFIPMNRKELDRYVKEIGRDQNRSPVVVEPHVKKEKDIKSLDVSQSELWDTRPRKKSKTPRKHRKLAKKTPIKQKSPAIIQSDEIGTTACAHHLSPVKIEDLEQKMSALHGHPPLPPPPEFVIPPPEPPIIEHVPELPPDDDPKLNDSRELKIIESDEGTTTTTKVETAAAAEDEHNSSAETVIERSRIEDDGELEDGEVLSSVPSPVEMKKEEDEATANRNAKIAKAVAQLAQETKIRLEQDKPNEPKSKTRDKSKRKKAARSPKIEPEVQAKPEVEPPPAEAPPPAKEPMATEQHGQQVKHKRNLNGAFELPNPPGSGVTTRRKTYSEGGSAGVGDKAKKKQRLSDPTRPATTSDGGGASKVVAKKKTETLRELFGSDDDNSFLVTPTEEEQPAGKRKRTQSAGEQLIDSKKSRKEDVAVLVIEEMVVPDKEDNATVAGNENIEVPENESVETLKSEEEKIVSENGSDSDTDKPEIVVQETEIASDTHVENLDLPENALITNDEPMITPEHETLPSEEDKVLEFEANTNDENKNNDTALSMFTDVSEVEIESVPKEAEDVPEQNPQKEEPAIAENMPNEEEAVVDEPCPVPEATSSHPHEVIVVSNKYCEYRIEDDNEAEITFYVTRKKKKKSKSKSRNASLNASGTN